MLKVGVVGISGRMGHNLITCAQGMEGLRIVCGVDREVSLPAGFNVEVKANAAELSELPDLFIDFSRPEATLRVLEVARARHKAMVIGTTGFDEAGKEALKAAAAEIPLVVAANFSVGVNVLLALIARAAEVMPDVDLEIVEAHHRYKVDSPSGTALAMGEAAARARGVRLQDVMVAGRNGISGERAYGSIGFASVRGGDIVGEHNAMFCADGERVEIAHYANNRSIFARGALRAALWLEGKANGLYSMAEVLGLN